MSAATLRDSDLISTADLGGVFMVFLLLGGGGRVYSSVPCSHAGLNLAIDNWDLKRRNGGGEFTTLTDVDLEACELHRHTAGLMMIMMCF